MPTYTYQCGECGHQFEQFLKMSNREVPMGEPCPECGKEGTVDQQLNPTPLNYTGCRTNFKTPDTFKDKLREIKKSAGKHSTIDV